MNALAPEPPAGEKCLRILIAEDVPADAELCLYELRKEGFQLISDVASTQKEFKTLLHDKTYDVILADYNLHDWNALDVLQAVREEGKDIPVILVTGSLGEEAAVECVKKGISDYVLKDRLARLPLAVRRALAEKAERQERRVLEQQLFQAQKMEAVGRLAGGIAHDFNNLVTIISGYSELLLDSLEPENPRKAYVSQIKSAGERAASLTRQLLAFSRKQVLALQVLDLNHVVSNLNKMLTRLIGEDIELLTLCPLDLGRVTGDPGQIEQVMMNLAVNARDAMPQGGKLTIETANVDLDENYCNQRPLVAPGSYVMLAMSDTGCGMSPETQARIFEPFFTTKEQGRGTGLGLSTVYGIIKQSGGYIWVYSEPGQGTTFKIYLPRVEAAVPVAKEEEKPRSTTGSETILLVEDDDAVRSFVRGILEAKGYALLEAGACEEALQLAAGHAAPIPLLLTDVVMPRMKGPDLAARLAPLHPETRVLYMSGYTDNAVVHHGILKTGTEYLQKPFHPEALARRVREVLDD